MTEKMKEPRTVSHLFDDTKHKQRLQPTYTTAHMSTPPNHIK